MVLEWKTKRRQMTTTLKPTNANMKYCGHLMPTHTHAHIVYGNVRAEITVISSESEAPDRMLDCSCTHRGGFCSVYEYFFLFYCLVPVGRTQF